MQIQHRPDRLRHDDPAAPGESARPWAMWGAVGGLAWGSLMRAWMRYISTDPEFSWEGTGMILGFSVLGGTLLGVAAARRENGGRGWWRLNGLGMLGLGAGAGVVMAPSVVLIAAAAGRRTWNRWLRASLVAVAVSIQVAVLAAEPLGTFPLAKVVAAFAAYSSLLTVEALALSVVFLPGKGGTLGTGGSVLLSILAVLPLLLGALAVTGVG